MKIICYGILKINLEQSTGSVDADYYYLNFILILISLFESPIDFIVIYFSCRYECIIRCDTRRVHLIISIESTWRGIIASLGSLFRYKTHYLCNQRAAFSFDNGHVCDTWLTRAKRQCLSSKCIEIFRVIVNTRRTK